MKPRLLALPLISGLLASSAFAGQFVWTGAENSIWTNPNNWSPGATAPSTSESFPAYGNNYTLDNVRFANGAGAGAIYNPGAGVTTTFTTGRGIVIGGGAAANLTVSSGTLAAVSSTAATDKNSDPIMGNNANATLLINGGTLDFTGVLQSNSAGRPFHLVWAGGGTEPGITSVATITSGTLACNNLNLHDGGSFGKGTINLEGNGVVTVNRIVRNGINGSSVINLDGGTLRARIAAADFLPVLGSTQVLVNENGGTIDSNGVNITIGANIDTHPDLDGGPDGGLIKTGVGNLILNGSSAFNGGVSVNQGRVILAGSDNSAGTGPVTLANTGAEVQIGGGRNFANPMVVANTGDLKTLLFVNTPGSTLSGQMTINESTPGNYRIQVNADNFLTLDGKITGTGAAGIHKVNPGWLNLRNAENDFTGGIQITGGILNFDNGGLGISGPITMDGGTLRWRQGFANEDVSSRLVMVDGKPAILSTGDENVTFVTFSQAIGNNSTASLVKQGSGWLYLTQPSTHTGGTTLIQGVLGFPAGGLGTTGNVTMDGGTLRWATGNTEDVSARMVMVDAKTATFATNDNNVSFANAIGDSSTGNLQKNGPGILTLNGTSSYTGNTIVLGGTLMLEATASITSSASVSISAGATLDASAQATYTIPGAQPLTFGIDATGSGSSGSITAADLDISAAVVSYNITGTPDDPVYVLATYNNFVGTPSFASVDPAPEGYTLDYAYQGNKIALVQAAGSPYEIWSDGAPFDGDANGDGVMDGLAFLLGAENINDNALGLLPTVTQSGSGLVLTFKSLNAASRGSAVLTVEHSSDLGISDAWLGAVIPDTEGISGPVNGVTFNVSHGSPTNAVIATISSDQTATGKLFGRLKAENP